MVGAFAHCFRYCGPCGPIRMRPDCGRTLREIDSLVGEVARSSAALAWRWLLAGPGLPSGSNSGLRFVFSLRSPWINRHDAKSAEGAPGDFLKTLGGLGVRLRSWRFSPRRGFSARCHSLLSGNRDELRKPAQHKNGFPSREEGNPVERANSKNRPKWPGGAACWAMSLQRWREHHALARPSGPGVGKVLRKVPM